MDTTHIRKAVDLAGTQSALAKSIGAAPSFVSQWVTGRRPVAPKYARAIEQSFGVSRHDLRPDVFGPAPEGEAV
ncbi:YdaS family helix-turn-helix protein [Stenotrophomonas humi]|uniref:transcriptional regulator n=1 Tax=Stenotrophomonas humi TaxID=405444 RepID=UPI0009FAF848